MGKVTMQDVAKAVGVSKNAVSLALRNDPQIPPATAARIQRTAQELGYVRDPVVGELMARLRSGRAYRHLGSLALVSAYPWENFEDHPTIPTYVEGCRRRARETGYSLDSFWMHEPDLSAERMATIFHTRNIRGMIIVGMMDTNRIPRGFRPLIETHPCVVTGVRTREPSLSFACVDHYMLALRAFEEALSLGYRRPGLVLDAVIDALVDHRFSAGYTAGQAALHPEARLLPFLAVAEARADRSLFRDWYEARKPDVIFTLYHETAHWLEEMGVNVPGEVALIQYEWRANHPRWAGMNQHNDLTGEAAVDMLIGMIHRGEQGPPPFPRATLIGATWVDGETAPARDGATA